MVLFSISIFYELWKISRKTSTHTYFCLAGERIRVHLWMFILPSFIHPRADGLSTFCATTMSEHDELLSYLEPWWKTESAFRKKLKLLLTPLFSFLFLINFQCAFYLIFENFRHVYSVSSSLHLLYLLPFCPNKRISPPHSCLYVSMGLLRLISKKSQIKKACNLFSL